MVVIWIIVLLFGVPAKSACDLASGRYACSMWEFSYMVRRTGVEAEFADWDKVLGEAAERGYNCLRIDAFPHLIAASSSLNSTFTVLPQPIYFPWGNHVPVTVSPANNLITFIEKAAEHDICIGLSAWYNDDVTHQRNKIVKPRDFVSIWNATLSLLEERALLDRILWVDICNEFPLGQWIPNVYEYIFGHPWVEVDGTLLDAPWSTAEFDRVNEYLEGVIPVLKTSFPDLRYTFSLQALGSGNMRKANVSAFDLAELHIWMSDSLEFLVESLQVAMLTGLPSWPECLRLTINASTHLIHKEGDKWRAYLRARVDSWAEWGRARDLMLVTTEAWGPINYCEMPGHPNPSVFDWVRGAGEVGIGAALEGGWRGIATSNFAEPQFPGMWANISWHQEQTRRIHASTMDN